MSSGEVEQLDAKQLPAATGEAEAFWRYNELEALLLDRIAQEGASWFALGLALGAHMGAGRDLTPVDLAEHVGRRAGPEPELRDEDLAPVA
jgi:hypothetical protein